MQAVGVVESAPRFNARNLSSEDPGFKRWFQFGACTPTTRVLAVVTAELETPSGGRSNEGSLQVNVELSPMASPNFEPGRPGESAAELAVVLERAIRWGGASSTPA